MQHDALVSLFSDVIGAENVIDGERLSLRHPGYCAGAYQGGVLLTPLNRAQVSRICAVASEYAIGLVAHGGLTGLVDGTETERGQVAVSFEKMNAILTVDPLQGILVAEAGVTLQAIMDAAQDHGMQPGIDLPSRGSAMVGGLAATNAGGIQAIRYGMMRENVLGLEVVLVNGDVIDLDNVLVKNNTGYDLKHMMIGSEGTLGFITRVTLKLHPVPARVHTALLACDDDAHLFTLMRHARAHFAGQLLSLEAMWPDYYRLTSCQPGMQSGLPAGHHAVYAVLEAGEWGIVGDDNPLETFLAIMFEAGVIADGVVAQSDGQREMLWRVREDSDAIETTHGGSLSYDVGLRLQDIPAYVAQLQAAFAKACPEGRLYVFGHLGDGNLHVMTGPEERIMMDALVYDTLSRFDGTTVSAEHGIGLEKRACLARTKPAGALATMRAVKQALDPKGLMNPGKVFS